MTALATEANNNKDVCPFCGNSEFWRRMKVLVRHEIKKAFKKSQKSWDRRPKSDDYWNEIKSRARRIISTYGYVNSQLLKESDYKFAEDFPYPAQIGRLFDKLVEDGDIHRFRMDTGERSAWYLTFRGYKEQMKNKVVNDKVRNTYQRLPEDYFLSDLEKDGEGE